MKLVLTVSMLAMSLTGVFTETAFLISRQCILIACSTPSFIVKVEAGQLLQFPVNFTSTVSGSLMATNSLLSEVEMGFTIEFVAP